MSEPVLSPNTQLLENKTAKQQALDAIATGKINLAGTYQNDFAFIGLDDVGVDSVGNPLVLVDGNVETVVLATPGSGVPAGVAPLASPVFTGSPTAPTQTTGDNSTKIATDQFVTTAVGTETTRAEAAEALLAPLASPALTGTPTAPTKTALTNNTDIATTAYTDSAVATETTRAETAEALALAKANNLSDVADAGSSRWHLSASALSSAAAVATSNVSLSAPGATIDGYSLQSNDEVLLTAQSTASQNGIWIWSGASSALVRPNEFPTGGVVKRGRTVAVVNGTLGANTQWLLAATAAGLTIDTTAQSWTEIGTGGSVSSVFGRTGAVVAGSGDYTVAQVTGAAPLASPALTGSPTAPTQTTGDNSTKVATDAFVTTAVGTETTRAEAAEALLAPLASPALTGSPTAPTQTTGDNSTKIATDQFVTTAVGTETTRAEAAEALLAPLASPALTGTPTAPTKTALTNNTDIATTAYTDSAVATETTRAETAEALALAKANNLSDVADAGSSRWHLSASALSSAAAVATSNVSLSAPGATIDGYSLQSNDEVLLTAQSTASQNGIWIWSGASSALVRPNEFPTGGVVKRGRTVAVVNGTLGANTQWLLAATAAGLTIDTTAQSWTEIGTGTYVPFTNGQVAEPLVDKGGQVFNVLAYGAKGDGSTNDTSAIQAAINAADANGGGVVYFPNTSGAYMFSNLVIYDYVTLQGAGMSTHAGNLSRDLGFHGLGHHRQRLPGHRRRHTNPRPSDLWERDFWGLHKPREFRRLPV